MDRIQHLVPAPDGGDDFIGVGGPGEGRGLPIVLFEESIDGGLQIDDRSNTPRLSLRLVSVAKKPSTALSHEQDVGVKWKTNRSCRASHWSTLGCLWAA